LAKVPGLETPDLDHFLEYVQQVVCKESPVEATT
jgi:hypothetical protein